MKLLILNRRAGARQYRNLFNYSNAAVRTQITDKLPSYLDIAPQITAIVFVLTTPRHATLGPSRYSLIQLYKNHKNRKDK